MLRIGYVRLRDAGSCVDTASLKAAGCHVVRAEEPREDGEAAVLASILEFVGPGDELVVASLEHLSASARGLLEILDRLEGRGASLHVVEPAFNSVGVGGRALRAVLEVMAKLEPPETRRRRLPAEADDIRALRQAGLGPVEIARRLGVSRMTVWRKLKDVETQS